MYAELESKIESLQLEMDELNEENGDLVEKNDELEGVVVKKQDKIDVLISEMREFRAEVKAERIESKRARAEIKDNLDDAVEHRNDIQNTLVRVSADHVPRRGISRDKFEMLVIMKDPNDNEFPYYVLHRQRDSMRKAIKKIRNDFPESEVILRMPHPNARKLWQSFRKRYGKYITMVDGKHGWFSTHARMTEELLIEYIGRVSDERNLVD